MYKLAFRCVLKLETQASFKTSLKKGRRVIWRECVGKQASLGKKISGTA